MPAPRVLRVLRARLTPGDALVHLAVAGALVLAYVSLPYEALLFRPGASGPLDAYRSLFGHADLAHLLGNVLGFLALAGLSLVLMRDASRRRLYYACFASILALVPPLAALQWTLALEATAPGAVGRRAGSGFSVVTAAFAALLAVAVGVHARERLRDGPPALASSAGLIALAVAVYAAVSGGPTGVAVGLGLVGLLSLGPAVRAIRATLRAARAGDAGAGETDAAAAASLSIVGRAAFFGAAIDLFVTRAGGAARPHAVGLLLGAALAWLLVGLERRVSVRRDARG